MKNFRASTAEASARDDLALRAAEFNDLCATCNFAADCLDRATLQRPVWFCEEFDCFVPVAKKAAKKTAAVEAEGDRLAADAALLEGICSNCESRRTCLHPKQDGARWYCEEYR